MKLSNINQVNDFLKVVKQCKGEVYLTSEMGDKFNLKSAFSQYIAMGALLGTKGDELELWCENKEDEANFLGFLSEHPDTAQ